MNKFKVGDEVEIVKLDKTIQHFGGEEVLSPVGTKTFVTYVDVTGEEVEIDEDIYSYHASDLALVNDKTESKPYNPLKANKFRVGDKVTFINYADGSRWEKDFGLFIGDVVQIISNHVDDRVVVVSKTGEHVWCFTDQLSSGSDESSKETQTYNPLIAQEGGGHYKDRGIQPLEYTMQNNLSFCEGNVVKYISRYKSKNGIEDLAKVIHYALLAAYEEYGEQGSTELKEKVLKLLGEHG